MKNIILVALISGVVGGVSATAVSKLTADEATTPFVQEQTSLSPGGSGQDEALALQLAELKKESDLLAIRMASLESRPEATREEVVTDESENIAALQDQVMELSAALQNPQSAQSAGLRTMVATAMGEVQEREEAERRAEREQRDIDRVIERMDGYAETLGLDAVQKKSMQEVLIDENSKRSSMFAEMREGNLGRDEIRSTMSSLRDETTAALGNILTPTQLESYSDMASDRFRWGGDSGRGGRGGRGN